MQEAKSHHHDSKAAADQPLFVRNVQAYLDARIPMRGLDPQGIHQANEIQLTIADLQSLLADLKNKTLALEKINAIENKQFGLDWEEIDHARLIASRALDGENVDQIPALGGDE